jgi:hypothetical protein
MDMMMTGRTQEEVGIRPGFLVVVSVIECLSYLKGKVPKTLSFLILWPVAEWSVWMMMKRRRT